MLGKIIQEVQAESWAGIEIVLIAQAMPLPLNREGKVFIPPSQRPSQQVAVGAVRILLAYNHTDDPDNLISTLNLAQTTIHERIGAGGVNATGLAERVLQEMQRLFPDRASRVEVTALNQQTKGFDLCRTSYRPSNVDNASKTIAKQII